MCWCVCKGERMNNCNIFLFDEAVHNRRSPLREIAFETNLKIMSVFFKQSLFLGVPLILDYLNSPPTTKSKETKRN